MARRDIPVTHVDDVAHGQGVTGEPSVSSAIAHLVHSSQGVITTRIDLAILEGQEFLSRTLRGAALVGFGMMLAAAAWFTMAACLILLVTPDASRVLHLALFGLLNGAGAIGLVARAMRSQPDIPARPNGHGSSMTAEA